MYETDYRIDYYEDDTERIREKTGAMLRVLLECINRSDHTELLNLYKESKGMRYAAKAYLEESATPDREREILRNIGYSGALLDVMQLFTEESIEQEEIHRINTNYKFDILEILAERGTMLHKDLAVALGVSPSGLTAVLQRMNSTSVKMINVEEVSKYKLYSLTAQAYKYYMKNKQENTSEKQYFDMGFFVICENKGKKMVKCAANSKPEKDVSADPVIKKNLERMEKRKTEKCQVYNFNKMRMEENSPKKKFA